MVVKMKNEKTDYFKSALIYVLLNKYVELAMLS